MRINNQEKMPRSFMKFSQLVHQENIVISLENLYVDIGA